MAPSPPARRGHSTQQLTSTIAALQFVYDRTHAEDGAPGPSPDGGPPVASRRPGWSFLSDHARLLVCLAEHPDGRLREVATAAAVPEGVAPAILTDLLAAGYLRRVPGSGPARFEVDPERPLHHPAEQGPRLGDVLAAWGRAARATPTAR